MRFAYAGFDLLYPAMQALLDCGNTVCKLFTCKTDQITEFNTQVIALASSHSIPYTEKKLTLADLQELQATGCDALLCAGYYYRVPILPGFPMINVHPSFLPEGRGAWPMPVAILRQLPIGGVSFHKMEASFDTGDILLQRSFPLSPRETLESYMQKLYALLPAMLRQLTGQFDSLYAQATPQGEGSYWDCPTEKDWTVECTMTAEQADRILRAFYGYECIYSNGSERYEFIGGRCVAGSNEKREFPVQGGYLLADKIRKLNEAS